MLYGSIEGRARRPDLLDCCSWSRTADQPVAVDDDMCVPALHDTLAITPAGLTCRVSFLCLVTYVCAHLNPLHLPGLSRHSPAYSLCRDDEQWQLECVQICGVSTLEVVRCRLQATSRQYSTSSHRSDWAGQAESRTVCSMISSPHFGEKYMYSCFCPCTVHTTMCLKCKEGNIKYTDCNCNWSTLFFFFLKNRQEQCQII